jgi:hypothetical protein
MTKKQVKSHLEEYLKSYNIPYRYLNDSGKIQSIETLDTMYLWYDLKSVGGIEEDVHFCSDYLYIRSYFSQQVSERIATFGYKDKLLDIINHINANVDFDHLISTPRLALSTDGAYDVFLSASIKYDIYELGLVECCQFISAYMPEFMEKIAPYILSLVYEQTHDTACLKSDIDRKIREEW